VNSDLLEQVEQQQQQQQQKGVAGLAAAASSSSNNGLDSQALLAAVRWGCMLSSSWTDARTLAA